MKSSQFLGWFVVSVASLAGGSGEMNVEINSCQHQDVVHHQTLYHFQSYIIPPFTTVMVCNLPHFHRFKGDTVPSVDSPLFKFYSDAELITS